MSDLPAPPVPHDLDLYDFPDMPLDGARLRDSKLVLKASGEEFRAAVLLWGAAWRQIPASSLPDDEDELCAYAGLGRDIRRWRKIREWALHGFIKCSDGRLYHPVIAEKALSALDSRRREESAKAKTRKRVREWRANQRETVPVTSGVTTDVTVTETPMKHESTPRREEKGREGNIAAADARVPPLAGQVCEIAGADSTTHANWHMVEPAVARWLASGCTPEDILAGTRAATAKRTAAGKGPPNSPAFFDGAIADAKAARLRPMQTGGSRPEPRRDTPQDQPASGDDIAARLRSWRSLVYDLDPAVAARIKAEITGVPSEAEKARALMAELRLTEADIDGRMVPEHLRRAA